MRVSKPMVFTLAAVLASPYAAQRCGSQQPAATYPAMAPLEQYIIPDREAEIALARSAAPPSVSKDATVLVLGTDGYHTAIEGKNGFTCLVERGWMSPLDSTDFWNPKLRGPICYNPPAARSILPYDFARTKLILAGWTKTRMAHEILASIAAGRLPRPEAGSMSYMMSKSQYLGDQGGHWHPHLMLHLPRMAAASWGANLDGSPVVVDTDHREGLEPETIFMIPVDHWSDGSPASHDAVAVHEHGG